MVARLTRYPSGLDVDEVIILELQTSEPSSVLFSDGTAYDTKVKAGGTRGAYWLESDGLHINVAGVDRLVPTLGADEVPSLGNAYIAGQTITANAGAIAISDTSTGSTNTLTLSKSGTNTGNTIGIDLDASVGGRALYIDAGAGARTAALAKVKLDGTFSSASGGTLLDVDVTQIGAASSSLIDIDVTSIYTGSILDVAIGAAATTGYVINADLNLGVAYGFMNIDCGNVTRTADVIDVTFDGAGNISLLDVNCTNTGSGDLIDIDVTGLHTGDALSIVYGTAASTGDAVSIDMGTNIAGGAIVLACAGARTDSLIDIADASTGNVALAKIATSAVYTGNVLELSASAASTGNMIDIDMNANLAGNAIYIDNGAGARTANLIEAKFDGAGNVSLLTGTVTNTGSGDLIDINVDSVHTGNGLDITYGTGAATGNAIDLNMGTNVAGSAIDIASAGTADGAVLNIAHTGNLANGATAVKVNSTGDYAGADGNTVEIRQLTGAGTAGNYALYISALGTNVEGLKVDDGGVVFDETLSVAGSTTLTGLLVTSGTQSLSGAGAVDVTNMITEVTTTGADALTLADGAEGQHKYITMIVDADDGTLTPAHLNGGSTITFAAVGDAVHLLFTNSAWQIVGINGAVVA